MAHEVKTSAAVRHALKQVFAPEANVLGVLIEADIGPISFGFLYGNDSVAQDGEFICFKAVGTDNRNGYDIVKTAAGHSFVVVTYAEHARARGLSFLQAHIRCNPAYYSAIAS